MPESWIIVILMPLRASLQQNLPIVSIVVPFWGYLLGVNLVRHWQDDADPVSFAEAWCGQKPWADMLSGRWWHLFPTV
ncbi:hypothetical protein AK812_SmicGene2387 [Symbiodinium microadriaticum]|uniref:Uncharacterized protein n=1 Tax=Symbiodinium microadriaticum TaxID=2951 RepID=A0A1Q9F1T8_SYMMI|nr:hypothetical protein AK812_SmicGene2387 [Symbiodinium microadriaticum]